MPRLVLNVGQCSADHFRISQILGQQFDVEVVAADSLREAVNLAAESTYDLILINRILDLDGTAGLDVLRSLTKNETVESAPIMLVSNYADAQQAAIQAGAVPGFGKAQLADPATTEKLSAYLGDERGD